MGPSALPRSLGLDLMPEAAFTRTEAGTPGYRPTMLDQLEALRALAETGTTGKAAARLRITQSAVSKRIAALESRMGRPLTEPIGRNVVVTLAGRELLADTLPLLRQIRERVERPVEGGEVRIRVAATESLVSAWLPGVLRGALSECAEARLELHTHRGPWVVERLRAGEVDLAVCVGESVDPDLVEELIGNEAMVLVGLQGALPEPGGRLEVWTIETGSLTGAWLERQLVRRAREWGWELAASRRIESFSAAVQLARAGFGAALVPEGIARSMGVNEAGRTALPGLRRPISLVAKATGLARPSVRSFADALIRGGRAALLRE